MQSTSSSPLRMRGAKPTPRHKLAAAKPFGLRGSTPAQFCNVPRQLSMWGNATYGDCVTAEEAFARACYNPEILISDSVAIAWAQKHGVLNGAELLQVMQWMETDGFAQDGCVYDGGQPSAVDYTNLPLLQNAISQGPVKIAVAANQLEQVVGNHNGWFAANFRQDGSYDHCVSLSGYGTLGYLFQQLGVPVPAGVNANAPGFHLFTWSTIGVIDVPSMLAITCEAWSRTPVTIIHGGPTPTPTPTPGPTPTPTPPTPSNLQQEIDALFAKLEAMFFFMPRFVEVLKALQAKIDSLFQARGVYRMSTLGALPDIVFTIVNDAFAWAEQQWPSYAQYLALVQTILVGWLHTL